MNRRSILMADTASKMEGKTAKELLNSGGRAIGMKDYASAVEYLSKACEVGRKEHSDPLHDSFGEIYLMYGKALLDFAREEGDPLGENVPKDVAVGEDEAEEEEGEGGEEGDVEEEEEQESSRIDDDDSDEEDEDEKQDDDGDEKMETDENAKNEEEEEKKDQSVEGRKCGVEFNGEKGEGDKADEAEAGTSSEKPEEEPSDLQVAWEVLELAKVIFRKRGDAGKEYLGDTLTLLGEISMEGENFEGAITDIKEAIELQKTLFSESSRVLAESYYKLGMALSMADNIEDSVECYHRSIEILNNRIKEIATSEKNMHKRETEEIKKLLPELEEKIVDMKNYKDEQAKKATEDPRPILPGSPEKKAMDITHLVKRKRKSDEEGEGPSSVPKKPALE